jgi:cephalosporin-C deacetylase-like acetyl esterase/lysophospholipase L1-like esterase
MNRKNIAARIIFSIVFVAVAVSICSAQQLTFRPYKPSGIYEIGEKVGWTAALPKDSMITGDYSYTIKKDNLEVIKTGKLEFAMNRATIETTLNEPGMIFVQVLPPGGQGKPIDLGAAVAPEKIQPSVPRPADFDSFWESKIKMLKQIPENAVLTPSDSGKPDVEYATIKMDHINGTHVYGQMAKPKKPGKFPALVIFQWASPPYPLQKSWVTERAAEGWLTLNIESHDVLPDQPKEYYDSLPEQLKKYNEIERENRDKNYFLQMYLADYRAVDYIASRPDWDGKTLVVMGTSMGGQQSFAVAGLNPKVTNLIVNVPAGADSNGQLHGRAAGYPFWPSDNPKIMQTALYFDTVNFASHITATSMVAMGFVDTTSPPVGIWATFNQIKGPKEAVPMVDSPHNHLATPAQQQPYTGRSTEWLNILVHLGQIKPYQRPPGDMANPRADQNSMLAHTQLLEKKTKGKIDVYFEGDSITRRWGGSDDQYKPLLENWNKNFFGWNAADFGWGGDTTQNVLWRLDHGELDGINPKVIVLLIGTNNVGRNSPQGPDDPRIADTTKGVKAVLDKLQQKAPDATIVLMAIFPRNDNIAVMPIINQINANIAKFADGKKVRYVNINDKMADKDDKLFDGITNSDKLHLEVKAYQIWADALKPIFTELLGPPAKEDHAPPPTGDPSARPR